MFTETLPRNERLYWVRYSGFQASCHRMNNICSLRQEHYYVQWNIFDEIDNITFEVYVNKFVLKHMD
jgi:hypothetical protein